MARDLDEKENPQRVPTLSAPTIICAGTFILDVLGRPILVLPQNQNSVPIEEIRITVAGTAGGTAVNLSRLGAEVFAVGAIGDDEVGSFLSMQLRSSGVDTSYLAVLPDVVTSATILPIDADGARPAWHVAGANRLFNAAQFPTALLQEADALHFGGLGALPQFDGPDATELLRQASNAGLLVTVDCLGVKRPDMFQLLEDALPFVDIFMPNDLEAMAITGKDTPLSAAHALLDLGAGAVLVTTGSAGVVGVDSDEEFTVSAHDVPAVDSTGCGDAFAAGVITRILALDSLRNAVEFGIASAALTLQGLGSDAGKLTSQRVADRIDEEGRTLQGSALKQGWNFRTRPTFPD